MSERTTSTVYGRSPSDIKAEGDARVSNGREALVASKNAEIARVRRAQSTPNHNQRSLGRGARLLLTGGVSTVLAASVAYAGYRDNQANSPHKPNRAVAEASPLPNNLPKRISILKGVVKLGSGIFLHTSASEDIKDSNDPSALSMNLTSPTATTQPITVKDPWMIEKTDSQDNATIWLGFRSLSGGAPEYADATLLIQEQGNSAGEPNLSYTLPNGRDGTDELAPPLTLGAGDISTARLSTQAGWYQLDGQPVAVQVPAKN
jgi:hypothetical protein